MELTVGFDSRRGRAGPCRSEVASEVRADADSPRVRVRVPVLRTARIEPDLAPSRPRTAPSTAPLPPPPATIAKGRGARRSDADVRRNELRPLRPRAIRPRAIGPFPCHPPTAQRVAKESVRSVRTETS